MKALVKTKRTNNSLELMEVDKPIVGENEVLVKIINVAICGSDIHVYEYTPGYEFIQPPIIIGHEFSGIVAELGSNIDDFEVGDRVIGESNRYCRKCENCLKGMTDICLDSLMTGLHIDGAMAEYITVPAYTLHKLPDNLPFRVGAIVQPISVSLNAVFDHCEITPGDTVIVFGPGIQGIIAAKAAQIRGASMIAIVGTEADEQLRLPIAQNMGIDTFNVSEGSIKEMMKTKWGIEEVDVVIDASGSIHAVDEGLTLLKRGGHLNVFGIYPASLAIDLTSLVRKNITIHTSYTSQWKHYDQALKLLSNHQLDVEAMIKEYLFEEFESAFKEGVLKEVLKPVLTLE